MWDWVDVFSLSWVVPLVLDSMMAVATAVYDYFVGSGDGIIYVLMWGWLAFSIGLYLVKMYFPKSWLEFFGLSEGGEMYGGVPGGMDIGIKVLRPMLRAMFAIVILLQIKPNSISRFVINPFLEFGAVYVNSIVTALPASLPASAVECPEELGDYLSKDSCEFLTRPIDGISALNNKMIKRGSILLSKGLGELTIPIIGVKSGILNIITGAVLIATFFSNNLFMALLILQGIFKFGLSLILYPFKVLIFVVKDDGAAWFNPWRAFNDLADSLKKLVIAMIAVAFILLINISILGALFNSDIDNLDGVGGHSITWTMAIMTFWIMQRVFALTRDKLESYVDPDLQGLYQKVADNAKTVSKNAAEWGKKAFDILKKKEK
ncbi:MAG: hypothetical protein LBT45_03425 [Rickettsiales bacterium]|jgi:hypothetical protein|nr:hypothetical protein [Rickettsiales bacterium]